MTPIGGIPTYTQNVRDLDDVRQLTRVAAQAAAAKGATDTIILEVGQILGITDAFVITSGRNQRQVKTIAEEVETQVKAAGGPAPLRREGRDDAEWVLIDFGDFVVHAFLEPVRAYYELERLWSDAPRLEWEEDVAASRAAGVPPS
jgi:ribosome-associated protein